MTPLIAETLEALRGAGWRVDPAPEPRPLAGHIVQRYPHIPALAVEFITSVDRCERGDQGCWLFTTSDYEGRGPDGFGWDEFERIFTEPGPPPEGVRASPPDPEAVAEARRFWDRYFPILPFVAGDYEYLAIGADPASDDFGKVVHGTVIDFDRPTVEADSYADFLAKLRDVAGREPTRSAVYDEYLTLFVHPHIIEDGSRPPWEKKRLLTKLREWLKGRP